jgi:hypothetical protein
MCPKCSPYYFSSTGSTVLSVLVGRGFFHFIERSLFADVPVPGTLKIGQQSAVVSTLLNVLIEKPLMFI